MSPFRLCAEKVIRTIIPKEGSGRSDFRVDPQTHSHDHEERAYGNDNDRCLHEISRAIKVGDLPRRWEHCWDPLENMGRKLPPGSHLRCIG